MLHYALGYRNIALLNFSQRPDLTSCTKKVLQNLRWIWHIRVLQVIIGTDNFLLCIRVRVTCRWCTKALGEGRRGVYFKQWSINCCILESLYGNSIQLSVPQCHLILFTDPLLLEITVQEYGKRLDRVEALMETTGQTIVYEAHKDNLESQMLLFRCLRAALVSTLVDLHFVPHASETL